MSALSNYLEAALLNEVFRNTAFLSPATYVALFTVAPTDAGGGTEVTGGAYARKQVNTDGVTAPFWTAPADDAGPQKVDNNSDVTFATATASWGTVVAVGIFDALTAGNLLYYGALTTNKVVDNGDTFKFATGQLKCTLA